MISVGRKLYEASKHIVKVMEKKEDPQNAAGDIATIYSEMQKLIK